MSPDAGGIVVAVLGIGEGPGKPPLTRRGREELFWLVAVALKMFRVVWSRFLAAVAAASDARPLVGGEDPEEEEDEATFAPEAADEEEEDRRFRNSASFAARA